MQLRPVTGRGGDLMWQARVRRLCSEISSRRSGGTESGLRPYIPLLHALGMYSELRLKKLRGSGGYVMASVTDAQQIRGNLGGPDLFLAPIGRLNTEKITKYYCNTCDKEYNMPPRIDYQSPNELVAENLVLAERGRYVCDTCNSTIGRVSQFQKAR